METIMTIVVLYFLLKMFTADSKASKSATKTCKHCGNQISIKATVCPYCRRSVGTYGSASEEARYMMSGSVGIVMKLVGILVLLTAAVMFFG